MRILVVGTGPDAVLTGHVLSRPGHEVRHAAPRGCPALPSGSVRIDVLDAAADSPRVARTSYRLRHDDGGSYEMVAVAVAHDELPIVLPTLVGRRASRGLVLAADLWRDGSIAQELLPRWSYLWSHPSAAGRWDEQGVLQAVTLSGVRLGSPEGAASALYTLTADLFATARVRPRFQPDIVDWLRTRFAVEAALTGAVRAAGGVAPLLASRTMIRQAVMGAREALRVAAETGVEITAFRETRAFLLPTSAAASLLRAALHRDTAMQRYLDYRASGRGASMLVAVTQTAHELGIDAPMLAGWANLASRVRAA